MESKYFLNHTCKQRECTITHKVEVKIPTMEIFCPVCGKKFELSIEKIDPLKFAVLGRWNGKERLH